MTNRREFAASALALALPSAPRLLRAQSARPLPVVGVLNTTATGRGSGVGFLAQGLREFGYEEGRHFVFDLRTSKQDPAAFSNRAAELVKRDVAVIAPQGPAAVKAALGATRTIPIVAIDLESDPVQAGWAGSLARPGGNLTGLFLDLPGLAGKWLDLLRSAAPDARRMGLLWDPTTGRRSASRRWRLRSAWGSRLSCWKCATAPAPRQRSRPDAASASARSSSWAHPSFRCPPPPGSSPALQRGTGLPPSRRFACSRARAD